MWARPFLEDLSKTESAVKSCSSPLLKVNERSSSLLAQPALLRSRLIWLLSVNSFSCWAITLSSKKQLLMRPREAPH
jgi:hypothetical protein